jgi:SAM-dependent methyltransferase
MEWFAKFAREQFAYWPDRVLDIGCNDGTQLDYFKKLGFKTYGVDPAKNLYAISSANHEIYCNFWDESSPEWFTEPMDAIVAQNSFAHNPNPKSWLQAAKACLREQGLIFIQTSQADMVINQEFDTIYHEHISFYNAASMQALARRADLHLIDVVKTPIHGTSYIFVLAKQPRNQHRVENIMATEAALGLTRAETYQQWAQDAKNLLVDVKQTVDHHRELGYAIVGYGAAAKGMTLINASGIHLDAVIDDNPMKQGLYCPGTEIPVVGPNYLTQFADTDQVLYVPLAWNFYAEISQRIRAVRSNANDRFMRYFPRIKIEN